MEGDESIHIKISAKFRTFRILPFTIAGINSKCTLLIENIGKTKLTEKDFRWKVESAAIDIGKNKKSTVIYYDIQKPGIGLEAGGEKEIPLTNIRPFIPGHHRLLVGIPDSEKGYHFIVGEDGEEVAGTPKQERIRFQDDVGNKFVGPWATYFEVYSWYLVAIAFGTIPAGVLLVLEIVKFLWEILAPGFTLFLFDLFRSVIAVI